MLIMIVLKRFLKFVYKMILVGIDEVFYWKKSYSNSIDIYWHKNKYAN